MCGSRPPPTVVLETGYLASYGKGYCDIEFAFSTDGRTLRPSRAAWTRLLKLHVRAGRVVETRPSIFMHPAAALSLQHELIQALADCLPDGEWLESSPATRAQAQIMQRFEDQLAMRPQQDLQVAEICAVLDVPERTLQSCCRQFLGMPAAQYLILRRLMQMRSALLDADPRKITIAEVTSLHGFMSTRQIVERYRAAFGETPAMTLQHASARWG